MIRISPILLLFNYLLGECFEVNKMGIIYKITNNISGKSYIGQTRTSLADRMRRHYYVARTDAQTGIDFAIKKYGKENFTVQIICECKNEELDEKEKYYIQLYDTYYNGYNLTLGGQDGSGQKVNFNIDEAYNIYLKEQSIEKAAKQLGCCSKVLARVFNEHNLKSDLFMNKGKFNLQKGTELAKKKTKIKELNLEFSSAAECARWLINNGYTNSPEKTVSNCVRRVAKGERMTYLGMHFEFI